MRTIFKAIVGSQAYGLSTPESDIDYKSVYIQSKEDILSNKYIPQIDYNKDNVGYELRRFLELVSTGNPNVLELLYLPERCIVETSDEWNFILKHRDEFLSKKCFNTFYGYAKTQIQKSGGLNKKMNWEAKRTQRKTVIDFCNILCRETNKVYPVKKWLKENDYSQDMVGLTSIDNFRDCYRLYVDDIKWAKTNHRFKNIDFSDRNYKGIEDEKSNQPKKSVIEKYRINDWKGIVYWNREQYSIHCKEYREYQNWIRNRNKNRLTVNKAHGQQRDGKNLMHTVRLIITAQEIPLHNKINVDRTKDRDYLMSIRKGDVDLDQIVETWTNRNNELKQLYANSTLKEDVSKEFVSNLELKIRNNEIHGK